MKTSCLEPSFKRKLEDSPRSSEEKEDFHREKQETESCSIASWFSLRLLIPTFLISFLKGAASGALVTTNTQVKKPLSLSLGKDASAPSSALR